MSDRAYEALAAAFAAPRSPTSGSGGEGEGPRTVGRMELMEMVLGGAVTLAPEQAGTAMTHSRTH